MVYLDPGVANELRMAGVPVHDEEIAHP